MKFSIQAKPISYFKNHTVEIERDITVNHRLMPVTQHGEAKLVVVMDVMSFEEEQKTFAMLKILARGNREIEQGKYRDAEDMFTELNKLD